MENLKYKGYIGSVEYSEEDNCLFGKVLGMNKVLISYEGETVLELKQDFMDGVDQYLESCKKLGITPQKSYSGTFNIRIPAEVHGKAVMKAKKEGISLNAFVRQAIEEKLNISENRKGDKTERTAKAG